MPDNILKYIFRDKSGAKHTVWKSDYDADPRGFAKAYPDARFEVVNRKTGDRGHVSVNDVGAAQKDKVVGGFPDGSFGPTKNITRSQRL